MSIRQSLAHIAFVAVACLITVQQEDARAAMYWGGTIKGATYGETGDAPGNAAVLEAFERHAGKQVTFINTGQQWASFDRGTMQKVIEAGAIPLVTMGSSSVTLAEVVEGKQDAQIAAWARAAREWGYPFLFRPWWEVNGAWYAWGRSPDFIPAWRHFHDIVVREGANNVTWAWIVNSIWWDPLSDPTPYYPGDEYVDWVGMDAYNWGLNPLQADRWLTPQQTIEPTLEVLERIAPGKPVCICEDASTEIGGDKPSWIREMLSTYLPHHPDIKAYLWFNWNVAQGSGNWDWPIESSTASEQAFREGIQGNTYLSRLPSLSKLQKVPIPPASGLPEPLGQAPPSSLPPDGGWSETLDMTEAGADAREPAVAFGPGDEATVAWDRFDGTNYVVQARRAGPGGSYLGPVETLSSPGVDAFRPQVAVGPDGTATVAWVQYEGSESVIYARRIGPEGVAAPEVHRLSLPGQSANQVQVASRPDGGAVVVWERYSGYQTQVQSRVISPAGVPTPTPANLSDGAQNAVEPHVVVEPDDSSIVVWTRYDGNDQVVQGRRVGTTGAPDPTTFDLSESGENAIEPALAMGADGSATVVWQRSDGADTIVQSLTLAPDGAPMDEPVSLSETGEDAVEPEVAADPAGGASVVWQRRDGPGFVVEGRSLDTDGSPSTSVYAVSDTATEAREPRIAVGPDGRGVVAWSRAEGFDSIIEARALGPSGEPSGPPRQLSAPSVDAGGPVAAAGPRAAALVAWRWFDGAFDRVQASSLGKPELRLSPFGHDFGAAADDTPTPPTEQFRIADVGGAPLTVGSVRLAGADPGQFALEDGGSCTGATINPGANCTVNVTFVPSTPGGHAAELVVATNTGSGISRLSGVGESEPSGVGGSGSGQSPARSGEIERPTIVSSRFSFGRPRLDVANGTAILPVRFPGPGTLRFGGKGIVFFSPQSRHRPWIVGGAGTLLLRLGAAGSELRRLSRLGRTKVRTLITYAPAGGVPRTESTQVLLRKKQPSSGLGTGR